MLKKKVPFYIITVFAFLFVFGSISVSAAEIDNKQINDYVDYTAKYLYRYNRFGKSSDTMTRNDKYEMIFSYLGDVMNTSNESKEQLVEYSELLFGDGQYVDEIFLSKGKYHSNKYWDYYDFEFLSDFNGEGFSDYRIKSKKISGNNVTIKAELYECFLDKKTGTTDKTKISDFTLKLKSADGHYSVVSVKSTPVSSKAYKLISLDGKNGDNITIDEYSYCEGDRYVIFFEPGVTVDAGLQHFVNDVMDCIEKETELKFYNKSKYSQEYNIYRYQFCPGFANDYSINGNRKKVEIFCMKSPISNANQGFILLNEKNARLSDYSRFDPILTSLLISELHYKNAGYINSVMMLGFETYYTRVVCSKMINVMAPSIIYNYQDSSFGITRDSAESQFINQNDLTQVNMELSYGYNFVSYIIARYGNGIMKNYIEAVAEFDRDDNFQGDNLAIAEKIKSLTSQKVFSDFGKLMENIFAYK